MVLLSSCVKEERYLTDSSARLAFSEDTVLFDTVFTTMATVTRQVKVYNRYDEPLLLSTVTLFHGPSSRFRINVDGDTSFIARDVEIGPHDSIFIFVQANINPNSELEPFLRTDSICFSFNNKEQYLPLWAYGRNAVYHLPTNRVYSTYVNAYGQIDTVWYPYSIIDCAKWDHDRPHVIFGFAVVNSNETLHLQAGDELYFANDGYLWVYDSATLDCRGTQQQPVLFSSMRHDSYYDTLPGQWGYVWLSSGSRNNVIDWARIENGTAGLLVDTNVNSQPTLIITNSIIENHSLSGIVGQGGYIVGENLLIDNCGVTLVSLQYGGRYRFTGCTFANYWRYSSRTAPALVLNNYYLYNNTTVFPRDLEEATFRNCILYGNYFGHEEIGELLFDNSDQAMFNYSFSHCLLRTALLDSTDFPMDCLLINREPAFVDANGHDYHLLATSPAIGAADATYMSLATDLDGQPRASAPAIGEHSKSKSIMYNYISGRLDEATPAYAVIDCQGVGYLLEISVNTYSTIKDLQQVKLLVHEVVREDAHLLFGFYTAAERDMFRLLLGVNGVGAATARIMLSSLTVDELKQAIADQDAKRVQKVKGIGAKTAQRILLELRDKVDAVATVLGGDRSSIAASNKNSDEALSALVMLGFPKAASEKVLDRVAAANAGASVEELIKLALAYGI